MNFTTFKDRAMDVDPDIRFMALEDLKKYLTSDSSLSNISNSKTSLDSLLNQVFPIVLNMLDDQNPEVQSQAIKSFEPMVKYLKNDSLIKLIKKLFTLVLQATKESSFTISIPNMALRSLFVQSNSKDNSNFVSDKLTNSNYKFDKKTSRLILDYLLPQFYENRVSIDIIELLIDILNEIGYVLKEKELYDLSIYLINISFEKSGIIGKKSIIALEKVTNLINNEKLLDDILREVKMVNNKSNLENKDTVLFQDFSVTLKRGLPLNNINDIHEQISQTLSIEVNPDEDLDFDYLLKLNSLKDEAFTTLIDLVSNCLPENLKTWAIKISEAYLNYNPFAEDDDFEDEDDDIEFSDDDEQENNDDDNDDGSWKLRAKSAILLKSILLKFPDTLESISKLLPKFPFSDSNDQVIQESIKTAILIIQSTSPRDSNEIKKIYPLIKQRLSIVKEDQLTIFLKLIETLNRFDNLSLIESVFESFEARSFFTTSQLEYLQFYHSILKYHASLPINLLFKISNDLETNLDDKSFNIIIETIKCINTLFHQDLKQLTNLNEIVDKLILIVENSKKYPSDLVRMAIISLGHAYKLTNNTEKILESFKISIAYEGTNKTTVDVLISLPEHPKLPEAYKFLLLEKLESLILSSNETTSKCALLLTNKIIQSLPCGEFQIITNLFQLLTATNKTNYKYIFDILNHLAGNFDQALFFKIAIKLLNDSKIDENDESFFRLLITLCKLNPNLYNDLKPLLNLNLSINAKVLAICCIENKLESEIEKSRDEFQKYYKTNINDKNFAYQILFLGYIGSEVEIQELDISLLIGLLKNENFIEELNLKACSNVLGLISKKHIESSNIILDEYKSSQNTVIRTALINALIISSDAFNKIQKKHVWEIVFNQKLDFDSSIIYELRKSGELLGKIITAFGDLKNTSDLKNVYLTLIITKFLLNNLESSQVNDNLLVKLILLSIDWLSIVNIDIRQIIVGNLLTALHQKSIIVLPNLTSLILPKIFKNLKAEDKFKKIITMGPYKYVLDQGLEVRKLCYEFIYSIVSLDDQTLGKFSVNLTVVVEQIILNGLKDNETDITVLSCINLINFIELHKNQSVFFFNDEDILLELINCLKLQLNKKLSVKASTQETDAHQERIKSIIKLTKKLNPLIDEKRDWVEYFNWIKEEFTIYYNSIDI
ncbi:unnamed protein product [Candida verbasci]|uniref:TATA-binding protein interacting (TIP20) domain-containing protein n=1 Tax=Candida verbasci TaxID=1227364 RepID=A0A9W4TWA1_9ASCO|nr:unnamed protein product [Candida verbasci]